MQQVPPKKRRANPVGVGVILIGFIGAWATKSWGQALGEPLYWIVILLCVAVMAYGIWLTVHPKQ